MEKKEWMPVLVVAALLVVAAFVLGRASAGQGAAIDSPTPLAAWVVVDGEVLFCSALRLDCRTMKKLSVEDVAASDAQIDARSEGLPPD